MEGSATFSLFSLRGDPSKAKILVLGSSCSQAPDPFCSLNIEHVSPTRLVRSGISRPPAGMLLESNFHRSGASASDTSILTLMRRWYWTRKPDAGFVLMDFPATLLQAKVLDEWMDARGESLTACWLESASKSPLGIAGHYRTLGLDVFGPGAFLN